MSGGLLPGLLVQLILDFSLWDAAAGQAGVMETVDVLSAIQTPLFISTLPFKRCGFRVNKHEAQTQAL